MARFFYVYVLSAKPIHLSTTLVSLANLSARLYDHNRGNCPHSAKYKPWKVEMAIAFTSEAKARAFEKYLKTGSGREFARRHF